MPFTLQDFTEHHFTLLEIFGLILLGVLIYKLGILSIPLWGIIIIFVASAFVVQYLFTHRDVAKKLGLSTRIK